MATFLSKEVIYRIIQREQPEGVYADGSPNAFYTTADNFSLAKILESSYSNLEEIYDNFFPQTADEKIADWELKCFGALQDASLTLNQRRDRIITFIRNPKGITISDMEELAKGVIGSDKLVRIIEWGAQSGTWIIGVSELGFSTYLGGYPIWEASGPDLCSKTWTDFGISEADWFQMRREAYTFEVLIFDYTLSADEREQIDKVLTKGEPARSGHVITDGLPLGDF